MGNQATIIHTLSRCLVDIARLSEVPFLTSNNNIPEKNVGFTTVLLRECFSINLKRNGVGIIQRTKSTLIARYGDRLSSFPFEGKFHIISVISPYVSTFMHK